MRLTAFGTRGPEPACTHPGSSLGAQDSERLALGRDILDVAWNIVSSQECRVVPTELSRGTAAEATSRRHLQVSAVVNCGALAQW